MKKTSILLATQIYAYLRRTILKRELIRFLTVGGVSVISNALFLFLLHGVIGLALLTSQIIAGEATIIVGFLLHHHWTYRDYQDQPMHIRFLHFNATALGGTIIANSILWLSVHNFGVNYLVGFGFGATVAVFWNYFSNKFFIWRHLN